MSKYVDADKLIAKLTKMQFDLNAAYRHPQSDSIVRAISLEYDDVISLVTSLQQEPRFPQYDNIVEKIFGAGNLEGWEFRDAEMLVALAKEELLKSLQQEQPEVDLEDIIRVEFGTRAKVEDGRRYVKLNWDKFSIIARHFYELGRLSNK